MKLHVMGAGLLDVHEGVARLAEAEAESRRARVEWGRGKSAQQAHKHPHFAERSRLCQLTCHLR